MDKLADAHQKENGAFMGQAHSIFKKRRDDLCADFKSTVEFKFFSNPDMGLECLQEIVESGKELAKSYFKFHSSFGNTEERMVELEVLEQKLTELGNEILEKQGRHVEAQTGNRIEMSATLLEQEVVGGELEHEGGNELELSEDMIKEECGEVKEEPADLDDLETPEEMDIDVKIEFDGMVLQKTYEKPNQVVKRSRDNHNLEGNRSAGGDVIEKKQYAASSIRVKAATPPFKNRNAKPRKTKRKSVKPKSIGLESGAFDMEEEDLSAESKSYGKKRQPSVDKTESPENKFPYHKSSCLDGNSDEIDIDLETMNCLKNEEESVSVQPVPDLEVDVEVVGTGELELQESSEGFLDSEANQSCQKSSHQCHQEDLEQEPTETPPASKRLKQMVSEDNASVNLAENVGKVNIRGTNRYPPLLLAIRQGQRNENIRKLLDDGADVNIKSNDDCKETAAHQVFRALLNKKMKTGRALEVLDLLKTHGFHLVNEGDSKGRTPLLWTMFYPYLNEKLLRWFFENGADFNASRNDNGDSVLLEAIFQNRSAETLRKIIRFGGDPMYVNPQCNQNVLHRSAWYAHRSALEMFLDPDQFQMDVNQRDHENCTPLHFIFAEDKLKYQECLEILLEKGADFKAKNIRGHVPLVNWIKFGNDNPFPVLMKMKHILPISEEIASAALTAIVEIMKKKSLQKYLPPSSEDEQNEFTQFITLLIAEKKAKLRLNDECQWKLGDWRKLDRIFTSSSFLKEVRKSGHEIWKRDTEEIKPLTLGELQFVLKHDGVGVPVETVLLCLLACRKYRGFVMACNVIVKCCEVVPCME